MKRVHFGSRGGKYIKKNGRKVYFGETPEGYKEVIGPDGKTYTIPISSNLPENYRPIPKPDTSDLSHTGYNDPVFAIQHPNITIDELDQLIKELDKNHELNDELIDVLTNTLKQRN